MLVCCELVVTVARPIVAAAGSRREFPVWRGEGLDMKLIARSLVVIFVALIAVPALAVTQTITTAVQLLAATTGLFMGGTQHPLSNPPESDAFIDEYMDLAETNYIIPVTGAVPNSRVAVIYPAEFFPVFGSRTFDDSVLVGRQNLNSCIRGEPATVPFLYRGPPGTHSLSSATRRVPWWLRSSSRTSLTTPRVRRPSPNSSWTRTRCGLTAA